MPSPNELSFLPDDYLERKAQRRTNVICAMLFLVEMVALGGTFIISERADKNFVKEDEIVNKEYTEAAKRIQLVNQLQDKQRQMAQQAELAASLLEKVPRSYLLAELTNDLPPGVSLINLTLDSKPRVTPPPSPTAAKNAFDQKRADNGKKSNGQSAGPKQYDVTLKIAGIAPTDVQVALLMSKLNTCKLLTDVNLVISDQFNKDNNDDSLRKFVIEATVNPNAEINPSEANNKTAALEIK